MTKNYFDYASASPVDARVIEVMLPYLSEAFGNPISIHSYSREPKKAMEEARGKVAELIGADKAREIIFTSGATESINLAIKGVAFRNRDKGNHIITTKIEHMSTLNTCKYLTKFGFEVTYLPVDTYGILDLEALKNAITDKTILISISYANGEIGTLMPVKAIAEIAKDEEIPLHVDAAAACGKVEIDVSRENISLLSISSNDIYGPKGVGALYIRNGTKIEPILHGGGQERGLRSGSENVAGIAGFGKAAEIAKAEMKQESERLKKLRDKLINGVLTSIPESYLNGHPTQRLPNNANFRFSYIEGESIILSLDMHGIAAASGSACTSLTLEPSHVLLGIGLKHEEAHGSLLFTLGRWNTEEEVDYVLSILPGVIKKLRATSPLTPRELR
ncbi:MAG: cysteine desulfurase family protein [Methanocellales archaeon]